MPHPDERSAPAERPPRPELARLVVCVWSGDTANEGPGRVLPDGCADIIWTPGRAPFVAGPDTGAKLETLPAGPRVGIRFRPGSAPAALGLPASEIRDLRVPLAELWPRDVALRLADGLCERRSIAARQRLLEDAVLERVRRAPAPDPAVAAAVASIERRVRGRPGAPGAGEAAGLGERQLRRRFVGAVGYGAKQLERVLRFQRFLELAAGRGDGASGLAELALLAGYADQPHLTRECTRLAGIAPAALARDVRSVQDGRPGGP